MTLARAVIGTTAALCLLSMLGCGMHLTHLMAGSFAGRHYVYDYSPSAMQSGNLQQIWWCGTDGNPTNWTQISDSIQYESIDVATNVQVGPFPVLGESVGAWDSVYTCNPRVIRGSFVNPLGDSKTYSYAMYYVATNNIEGVTNSIGVAFSNDGISWRKYPQPIIAPTISGDYGVGQPAVFNSDQKSAIRMFYEDSNPVWRHFEAASSDGVHFHVLGELTLKGLDPSNPNPNWGDIAYDSATGYWYAAFNLPVRDAATTGGVPERGQYGIQIYRIPDDALLTGATPWQLLTVIDTLTTGYESNFLASFLHGPFGDLNVAGYPTLKLFTSISNPPPPWNASPAQAGNSGSIAFWDISTFSWAPDHPLRTLNRYINQTTHEVTTGWIDPGGGFTMEKTLGHLYESPQSGAIMPFYGCKAGTTDYFVSLDASCGGARILGTEGYGYAMPVAGMSLMKLYRCNTGTDDFVSNDVDCEGNVTGQLLGYALP